MENNKNSDLEKKEGRIDDLLRVLLSFHVIPAIPFEPFIYSSENIMLSVSVLPSSMLESTYSFCLHMHKQVELNFCMSLFFLSVCSAPGQLWSKETNWWTAEDAGAIQRTLEQVCDHVQEAADWKSMFFFSNFMNFMQLVPKPHECSWVFWHNNILEPPI